MKKVCVSDDEQLYFYVVFAITKEPSQSLCSSYTLTYVDLELSDSRTIPFYYKGINNFYE